MKNLFLFFTLALFFGCNNRAPKIDLTPEQLLLNVSNNERYASTDQVADWIINQDPNLRLVDVRDHAAFDAFSLPGAINIPFEKLLDTDNKVLLDCERYMIVFYSNDDLTAANAWMLARRIGCNNTYVIQGGLNRWTENILSPSPPGELASAEEIELYNFRKAAGQFFIGGSEALSPEKYEVVRQPVVAKKKNYRETEKEKSGGGRGVLER